MILVSPTTNWDCLLLEFRLQSVLILLASDLFRGGSFCFLGFVGVVGLGSWVRLFLLEEGVAALDASACLFLLEEGFLALGASTSLSRAPS